MLAGAVGQIIPMSLAVGPVAHLRTQALYVTINSRRSRADKVLLPAAAQEELEFWREYLSQIVAVIQWKLVSGTWSVVSI